MFFRECICAKISLFSRRIFLNLSVPAFSVGVSAALS